MRIPRATGLAATALALMLLAAACGGDDGGGGQTGGGSFAEGTTMARLEQAGKVRVGTKFDQPLFGQKNLDGNLEGFDVEIAKIIAGELGIQPSGIEWVESVSANREPFIEQG
jgi:glutamate transport system substrate-binding protein